MPAAEVVGRAEWAEANLEDARRRCSTRWRSGSRAASRRAGPFAGALRLGTGVTLAAEVGLVIGYMSQRVLGQYELSLLGPEAPRRGCCSWRPTSSGPSPSWGSTARASCAGSRSTSSCTRSSSAACRGCAATSAELLRDTSRRSTCGSRAAPPAACPRCPDPAELVERFREGGLAALVQTREQRGILDRMQAAMAVMGATPST